MPRPGLPLRDDLDAETCRRLAAGVKDVRQARRLLSLAAAYDCMSRAEVARIGRHCATGVKGDWGEGRPEFCLVDRIQPRSGGAPSSVSMQMARMVCATWRALAGHACWMQIRCSIWPRLSRPALISKRMVSCAGGGSIFAG